ncbi:MAG: hypothetical protein K0R17_2364 [Rariglobus sp.]|jgi:transglutaminase-like putative cysteine protease|nr:hypothetical protein [Rariglobus sp.]
MPRLRLLLVSLVLLQGFCVSTHAGPRAFIIMGLAASETQADRLKAHTRTLREGFLARGLSPDAITILGASGELIRRDALLAALASAVAPGSGAAPDETWLVLLGTAAARGGEPHFQIAGPRLTASDLAAAVKALPGRRYVVVATSSSGGFLPPLLALPGVEAVSATADFGEINEPRFAEAWAETLVATPHATFAELAAAAATRVTAFYESSSLAQGEHARLIDRATGRILEAPFAQATAPAAPPEPHPSKPAPGFSVADIEIPKPSGDTEIERRPSTDETRALLVEAREATKESSDAALFLRIDTALVIGSDFAVIERHRTRAYLRTGEALDDLGTLWMPSDPPHHTTRLEGARVITPDGSQILVNPRSLDERRAADRREADDARTQGRPSGPPAPAFLPLPEVTAGCIVEAAWTIERRSSGELPEFSETWPLVKPHPVRSLHFSVTTPDAARWRVFAPNLAASTVVETPGSRTSTWTLADLPAFESRAGDPPALRHIPWVGVSSLPSWDAFAAWYQRIAIGSQETGPAIAALAAEIAAAHPDRAGRLRAAYERVAALRYVAIELGVGAFRPRTPGQVWTQRYGDCKDKAGLLVAVLGKLGIPAEFALVNRYAHTFTDWPAWQFNHALARVPAAPAAGQPHDLWLDATDRLVPFGIVSPGDLGRHAFAFNAQGNGTFHEITATQEPKSEWREHVEFNPETSVWTLRLSATGSAEVTLRRLFADLPAGVRREQFQAMLALRTARVTQVAAGDPYDLSLPFVASIEVTGPADALEAQTTRFLVPGLEFFRARLDQHPQALSWDDGRPWTLYRNHRGTVTTCQIPGYVPPTAPDTGLRSLMIP